jgi:hypothetical protein
MPPAEHPVASHAVPLGAVRQWQLNISLMSRGYCGFAASLMELDRIGLGWIANANANSSLVLWPRMSIEVINVCTSMSRACA